MSFIKLILKNSFKKKFSALLSIVGMGVGIMLIVALGSITAGIVESTDNMFKNNGYDFYIQGEKNDDTSIDTSDSFMMLTSSNSIEEDWINKIKSNNGVEDAIGVYLIGYPYIKNQTGKTPQVSYIPLIGMSNINLEFFKINLTDGTLFKNNDKETILGKGLAEKENKTLGDTFKIGNIDYKIVGIFENEYGYNTSFITSLKNVQEYADDSGHITFVYIKAKKGVDVKNLENELEKEYGKNITVIKSINDVGSANTLLNMLNLISSVVSLLAIFVGGIGILNSMTMSVYERTREIGVLKAVGWKNTRIIKMILGESLVLTIISAIFASIIGVVASKAIFYIAISKLDIGVTSLNPAFPPYLFVEAIAFAIIIGLLGGFYPAYKASKLPPTEALRYE
jgi:putative ABC transport system permease protein